ncbi:carbohydrate kinase family protein [Jatrophihabitans sp. YIM 134969]
MISVIGEAIVDLQDDGEGPIEDGAGAPRPFTGHPGGSPMNVAVGVARLERPAAYLGRLAGDAFGRLLRAHLVTNRVDLSGCVEASEPSTAAIVSLDSERKATYDFYVDGTADWQWTAAELETLPAGTRVLHTASLASWLPPGDVVIAARVGEARRDGVLTSYDPNVRPALMPADAAARVEHMVAQASLVKVSDDDLAFLHPGVDPAEIGRRWTTLGPELVIVTRGADGADAFSAAGHVHRDGIRVDVVDTVGAGDAYMAGLLAGLDTRDATGAEAFTALAHDPARVHDLLGEAMVVAAITCTRAGANPPTRAEVEAYGAGSA